MIRRKIPYILGFALLVCVSIVIASAYPKLSDVSRRKEGFNTLKKKINSEAIELGGDFSFVIKDLSFSDFKIILNEDKSFPAASLIKLPIMAVVFKAVRESSLSFDKKVKIKRKDVAGGSGIIKAMQLPLEVTVKKLLDLMIALSDNTATNKIIDLLGYEYINESFKQIGLNSTVLKRKMMDFSLRKKGVENYISARDIALLLEKIYNKELIDSRASGQMLDLLQKQKVNDRIPRFLPEEVVVAHKTGLEKGIVHDAGIVFSSKGDFIICALTEKVGDLKKAKDFIGQLSLSTYKLYE